MELTCHNKECGYTWDYKGEKLYPAWVACPNCLHRVKLLKVTNESMQIKLLQTAEVIDLLKQRLHNGWIVLLGDTNLMIQVEQAIYPPGSKKNRDFETIGFPHTIYIGRKTNDLKILLGNPADIDDVLAIILHEEVGGKGILTEVIGCVPETRDSSINELVKRATAQWQTAVA